MPLRQGFLTGGCLNGGEAWMPPRGDASTGEASRDAPAAALTPRGRGRLDGKAARFFVRPWTPRKPNCFTVTKGKLRRFE